MTRTREQLDTAAFEAAIWSPESKDWQCPNVIVANEAPLVRRGHRCCSERDHTGDHECGCGQTWKLDKRYNKWRTKGLLTDVVFVDDIVWGANHEAWGESVRKHLRGEDSD